MSHAASPPVVTSARIWRKYSVSAADGLGGFGDLLRETVVRVGTTGCGAATVMDGPRTDDSDGVVGRDFDGVVAPDSIETRETRISGACSFDMLERGVSSAAAVLASTVEMKSRLTRSVERPLRAFSFLVARWRLIRRPIFAHPSSSLSFFAFCASASG